MLYKTMDTKIIQPDKLKATLIKRTAEKTGEAEDVVSKIIDFEFTDAREALKRFSEVEITGFGKFIVSNAKVRKKIRRLHDIEEAYITNLQDEPEEMTDRRRDLLLTKLGMAREAIEYLKTRML